MVDARWGLSLCQCCLRWFEFPLHQAQLRHIGSRVLERAVRWRGLRDRHCLGVIGKKVTFGAQEEQSIVIG
jgi:hypothetical protein